MIDKQRSVSKRLLGKQTDHVVRESRGESREGGLLRYYVLDALRQMLEPDCLLLEAVVRKVGWLRENEPLAE